jgi:hypothetical protein
MNTRENQDFSATKAGVAAQPLPQPQLQLQRKQQQARGNPPGRK